MNEVNKAIDFFWLELPLKNRSEIKKRYRKLSMIHHPDRWGKEEDFKLLWKYKNILEKNFYKLNTNYSNFKKEKEDLKEKKAKNKNFIKLVWYEIKFIKIWFLFFINFLVEYIVYNFLLILVLIVKYIFLISLFSLLFILPIALLKDLWPILEPNYIYWKSNFDIAISFLWKITIIYLIILAIYSILYQKYIKKYMMIKINRIIDKIWKYELLNNFKNSIIYYFIFLYIITFIVNNILLLIL